MAKWIKATPEEAGFAANLERRLAAGLESGLLLPMHTVAMSRAGKLVLEQYYEGEDESWGDTLGRVSFGPEVLHDLRSVTKSVVGLLYGIALERGLVPPVEAPVIDAFPEYPDLVADPARRKITVEHTLNMTMGMEWDENRPYTDPANSEIAMEMAPDRYRFILDRPIVGEPGQDWIYSGGAVALIGALIERGTGKRLPDFAREALFEPMGISDFHWLAGSDGVASPASGLRLTAPDLLRIGAMLIDGGRYEGRQVVPEDRGLVDASSEHARRARLRPAMVHRRGPGARLRQAAPLDRRLRQWRPAHLAGTGSRRRLHHLCRRLQPVRPLGDTGTDLARDRAGEPGTGVNGDLPVAMKPTGGRGSERPTPPPKPASPPSPCSPAVLAGVAWAASGA